ncbi:CHAT domain-containing protein, partial [Dokdonella sp.]|uniref:CHAT domain-containing protein n=1 Tax=Dokdonella sp. TaxID=2291710 RepID=UPI002F404DFA
RERVLDAMGDPGAWVHIAAHGTADPRRIGYAGFWLDPPSAGGDPVFISWLDVLGRGAKAGLVVLDACQLGKGGSGPDGSFGFASAVSEAGANQVVASLWAVSDAASTAWTRAFYSSLAASPDRDSVEALRVAQQELRRSRMFRHPFYWAGWRSFSRIAISNPMRALASGDEARATATPQRSPGPARVKRVLSPAPTPP